MIAGVPGVGISGIFYLVCAISMPFIEIIKTLRGRSSLRRWRVVMRQFNIVCGIIVGSWVTGLLIMFIVKKSVQMLGTTVNFGQLQGDNVLRAQPLLLSLLTMFVIFSGLNIYNFIANRRKSL